LTNVLGEIGALHAKLGCAIASLHHRKKLVDALLRWMNFAGREIDRKRTGCSTKQLVDRLACCLALDVPARSLEPEVPPAEEPRLLEQVLNSIDVGSSVTSFASVKRLCVCGYPGIHDGQKVCRSGTET